jgi:soluble P-type ATPase
MVIMSEIQTKIVIVRGDGRAAVYPNGTIDTDSTAGTVVQDVKDMLQLGEEYELYIKVSSGTKLSSLKAEKIEGIAILPKNVKPSRSVSLGQ